MPRPELWPQHKEWCFYHRAYGQRARRCLKPCPFDPETDPQEPPQVPDGYDLDKMRWKNPMCNGRYKADFNTPKFKNDTNNVKDATTHSQSGVSQQRSNC